MMNSNLRNRRNLIGHLTSLFSLVGLGSLMTGSAMARKSPAPDAVRKLDRDGKPADGKQMITPLIIHNGLIYIAGPTANRGQAHRHRRGHAEKLDDCLARHIDQAKGNCDHFVGHCGVALIGLLCDGEL